MKLVLSVGFFLIFTLTLFSQNPEVERLKAIKEELLFKKAEINDSIKKIQARINYLDSKDEVLKNEYENYVETTTRSEAKIKNNPDVFGDIIGYIAKGESLKVIDYFDTYWLIMKDSIKGYTSELYLVNNKEMEDIKKDHDKNEIKKKYGESIAKKIFNHEIWIGMNTVMARLSIGSPIKINRSTGSWGTNEQWIYKNKYLYFKNGVLSSWQD